VPVEGLLIDSPHNISLHKRNSGSATSSRSLERGPYTKRRRDPPTKGILAWWGEDREILPHSP